jgi:hypothetical protein
LFRDIYTSKKDKAIIFQDMNNISSFDKIESLNSNYLSQKIRYLYLDLNIINNINTIIDKRKYLAYYIARIYNCTKKFKNDFQLFVNRILKI